MHKGEILRFSFGKMGFYILGFILSGKIGVDKFPKYSLVGRRNYLKFFFADLK